MPKNHQKPLTRELSKSNKIARQLWRACWILLFRPTPRILHPWRRILLRAFGAKIARSAYIYPSVQIWAPWNLEMQEHSCLSHFVDCYCVDKVLIGRKATVSQYSFLCTASHNYNDPDMPLITAPITVGDFAWVTSDVFIGPGVTVGTGAVVGARSTVNNDIREWTVVAGSPAKIIGQREKASFEMLR